MMGAPKWIFSKSWRMRIRVRILFLIPPLMERGSFLSLKGVRAKKNSSKRNNFFVPTFIPSYCVTKLQGKPNS